MQKVILVLLVFLISYCLCNNVTSISFTRLPETINPGDLINLEWNYTDSHNYNVEISLCNHIEGPCQKLASTTTKTNQLNLTMELEDSPCYFKEKSIENWYLLGSVIYSKSNQTHFNSKMMKRNLICEGKCKEDLCLKNLNSNNSTGLIPNNNTQSNNGNDNGNIKEKSINNSSLNEGNENNNKKKSFPYIPVLFVGTLGILILAAGGIVYVKKFKKKEDDPIPIFSVEDSSYCCDMSAHSQVLGNASFHSNAMEKTILSINRANTNQTKIADQSHLSVQLHPISSINDGYSHSSQASSRTRETVATDNSFKISQEKQNELNGISLSHSNSGSPYLAALSPISMASSIAFVSSPKPQKKMSVRHDNNTKHHHNSPIPNVYAESAVIVDKKANNSYLISEIPVISDNRSGISSKRSFNSTNEETKVLSSKHYVLSNFEGDYDKEELNLHYGDIVSVINILPEGWAYGELLLKYDAYTKTKMKPLKGSRFRKFGYYPIKCLSPDEESEESNSPPKKILEEENEILAESASINEIDYNSKDNKDKEKFINQDKLLLPLPSTKQADINNKEVSTPKTVKTINSKSSKRSSILKIFKRSSKDLNKTNKEPGIYYSEPNSSDEKLSSKEIIINDNDNDNDSDTETVYHDAEEEENSTNKNKVPKFDSKRISVRSSISYRSYM